MASRKTGMNKGLRLAHTQPLPPLTIARQSMCDASGAAMGGENRLLSGKISPRLPAIP